jgi:tRNA-Thr(GGU) m(6)t(6)A37 methyltransferase TsaA
MTEAATQQQTQIRAGEVVVPLPDRTDASVLFIGRIRTPWTERRACPRQGDPVDGPICRIEVDDPWRSALAGLGSNSHVQVFYWMHFARRDLVLQSPRSDGIATGTFSLRSPNRPNPIAASDCTLIEVGEDHLLVRGLDCLDGTPLLDLKPISCPEAPRPKA